MHSKRGTAPTGGESEEYIKCSPVKFEEHVGEFFEKVWILGAEKSTCDLIHHMFQLWDPLVVQHGIISKKWTQVNIILAKKKIKSYKMHKNRLLPRFIQFSHIRHSHAEDEQVLLPGLLGHLHVGAVHGADGQSPVQHELHVSGSRSFGAGSGDLL